MPTSDNPKQKETSPRDIQTRSFDFALRIVTLYRYLQTTGGVARSLSTQILRSGTSIGANLEEACAGQSKADFISKCAISLKEARETHYWLRLLAASSAAPADRLGPLTQEADELIAILTTIVRNASSSKNRESKS
ncbi:MAG: four helix bundle protein [Deltaproteobacteria bacterium]|nr:four helix bundle protein [Deltaproteobacteria bacterium]